MSLTSRTPGGAHDFVHAQVRTGVLDFRAALPRALAICAREENGIVYQLCVATWCGLAHGLARCEGYAQAPYIYREAYSLASRHLPGDHPMIPLMRECAVCVPPPSFQPPQPTTKLRDSRIEKKCVRLSPLDTIS